MFTDSRGRPSLGGCPMTESAVVVNAQAYEHVTQRVRYENKWQGDIVSDSGRRMAELFIEKFDPMRWDEWGHISFCMEYALNTLRKEADAA